MKRKINLVITDLDDTIWDWLQMWYKSFSPYYNRILEATKLNPNDLKKIFKILHKKYHTTEASFAYKELKKLTNQQKEMIEKDEKGKSIIHQYYSDKKHNLKLNVGVLSTLLKLKKSGTKIIGFTESNSFFTKYRLKTLGLDGIFDKIYSPIGMGIPTSVTRSYTPDYWEPIITEFRELAQDTKKPNPCILEQIIEDEGGSVESTVYIGDKLEKDIYMANQVGVYSVHAAYGHNIDGEAYELLKEVTHWTDEEVQREIEFKEQMNGLTVSPDFTVSKFSEILDIFEFIEFVNYSAEDKTNIIDIWKNTVDVQKHFNNIEMNIRSFVLTLFTFLIGAIGFGIKENTSLFIFSNYVSLGELICIGGLVPIFGFYLLDRHHYHRLLHSAVRNAMLIENNIKNIYPQINLASSIKKGSPIKIPLTKWEINSDKKVDIFYFSLVSILITVTLILHFNISSNIIDDHLKIVTSKSELVSNNNDLVESPQQPGIIIKYLKDGSFESCQETSDINSSFEQIPISEILGNKYYYCVLETCRKEVQEYISKKKLLLNQYP